MKKTVLSVRKLKEIYKEKQGEKLNSYPVDSDWYFKDGKLGSTKGFYIGVLPVYRNGYGLTGNTPENKLHFRGEDNLFVPIETKEHSHVFIQDEYYLKTDKEYFLDRLKPNVTIKLQRFGFTEDDLNKAVVEIEFPYQFNFELQEEELLEIINCLETGNKVSEQLLNNLKKKSFKKPSFIELKNLFLERNK